MFSEKIILVSMASPLTLAGPEALPDLHGHWYSCPYPN